MKTTIVITAHHRDYPGRDQDWQMYQLEMTADYIVRLAKQGETVTVRWL